MTTRQQGEQSHRVVLLGAGKMGGAMASGWRRGFKAAGIKSLDIVDPHPSPAIEELADGSRIRLNAATRKVDVAIIGVKPQSFEAAAAGFAPWISPDTVVVSIMLGISLARIAALLGAPRVVRAMPNTPGAIGKGVTGYALSPACGPAERALAEQLLAPLGQVVGPVTEKQLDIVTAVSGCGPAYVFLLAETMEAAARSMGLDPQTAAILARGTVSGAGALLAEGEDPSSLRKAVTSPGGATAAAIDVLMNSGAMPDLMRRAVEAAAHRSVELSAPPSGKDS